MTVRKRYLFALAAALIFGAIILMHTRDSAGAAALIVGCVAVGFVMVRIGSSS